ncbi:MAG TPA: DUF6046 domain-containing protein [Puia sp.]|nr:DUF6046 domain-containing protein [Puia sp.]
MIIINGPSITGLIRAYNLQNVRVLNDTDNNPYKGQVDITSTQDDELYKSSLGTPVLTNVVLLGDTYTDQSGKKITFEDITLDTVLLTVQQSKNIVVTEIQGSDTTVKEYIGMGDYQVTINGIIVGPNGHFPIDEVNALQQLLKAPIPITVVSRYLQNLDIYSLVIKDFAYDQEPGGYSKQNFSINCMSDAPVELQEL